MQCWPHHGSENHHAFAQDPEDEEVEIHNQLYDSPHFDESTHPQTTMNHPVSYKRQGMYSALISSEDEQDNDLGNIIEANIPLESR